MYNHCIQSLCTPLQYTVRELLESILGVRQGKTRPGQARQGTSVVKLDEDDGEERHLLADSQSADTLARARGRQAQAQAQAQATATATAESIQQTAVLAMLLPSQLPPRHHLASRNCHWQTLGTLTESRMIQSGRHALLHRLHSLLEKVETRPPPVRRSCSLQGTPGLSVVWALQAR